MLANSLALLLSLTCVSLLPALPSPPSLLLCVPLLIVLYVLRRKPYIPSIPVALFLAGFVYGSLVASSYLSSRLPAELLGIEVEIVATVVDLPGRDGRRLRFLVELESIRPLHREAAELRSGRVRLNWYGQSAPDLKAGNKIKLIVKLKAPSGFMNPGGFDIEKWFAQKKIVATGYVRNKSFDVSQSVVAQSTAPLSIARNLLQRRLLLASEAYQSSGVIVALAVGDRSGVSPELWQSFISTGTNHLLAISGLHISLVAGAFAMLVQLLWRFHVFPLRVFRFSASRFRASRFRGFRFKGFRFKGFFGRSTRRGCSLVVALCAAFCYAAMAGFSVPTVRALMMFSVLVFLLLLRRHQNRIQSLSIALLVVCLVDPLSVMSPGFWMSFAAVAVLLMVFSNAQGKSHATIFLRVLRGHVLITVGLYPLTVMFFGQASLVSPLANLLVTPLIGLLVTPLVFVAALLVPVSVLLASKLLFIVDFFLRIAFELLEFLSNLPFAMIKIAGFSNGVLCLAALSSFLMLLPISRTMRAMSLVLVLPLVIPVPAKELAPGEYSVTFLDVGQGTSVVVKTATHALVYDTGDQFSSSFSAADAVVLPYLHSKSIKRIDKLIVSHIDRDHSGGADEIMDELQVEELMLSEKLPQRPEALYRQCVAGDSWNWDGVELKILHPQPDSSGSRNDQSCVLMIDADGGRTLLPGDIEAGAEALLVSLGQLQAVEVLLSPHHGSASSSGKAFVTAVNPAYVVHTVGYKNRFDFPRPEAVDNYGAVGARQFTTAQSGALEFLISEAGVAISEYRIESKRWWSRSPDRSMDDEP